MPLESVTYPAGSDSFVASAAASIATGWSEPVWAERLMEKERHAHAQALESDRAQYAKELEGLKAKYEQTHRRLQAELDKTIYGHQLKTQTEFNALMEMWKRVPPLESAVRWAPVALGLAGSAEAAKRNWTN